MLTKSSDTLGFLIHDVGRLMRSRFDARARSSGATRQQWRVLLHLSRGGEGRSQAELADGLEVERITLCRMIDRLAEAGLVERRPDPSDRRVWRIHLLPPAHAIVDQLTVIARSLDDDLLALLDPADRPAFVRGLESIRGGLRARAAEKDVA